MSAVNSSVALVTDISDNTGKETARRLAKKGQTVVMGVRDLTTGQRLLQELLTEEHAAELLVLDSRDPSSVSHAADTLLHRHGKLDVLINNHSIAMDKGPLSLAEPEDLIATFETNIFGNFRCIRAFLPLLRKSSNPRVVNISSSLGSVLNMTDKRSPYYEVAQPMYAASKAALNVLTIHLARELKEEGIKINAVDPGIVDPRVPEIAMEHVMETAANAPVRYALIGENGPSGGFFDRLGPIPW